MLVEKPQGDRGLLLADLLDSQLLADVFGEIVVYLSVARDGGFFPEEMFLYFECFAPSPYDSQPQASRCLISCRRFKGRAVLFLQRSTRPGTAAIPPVNSLPG